MDENFIRITIKYNGGNAQEILCSVKDYQDDMDLFAKDYKKFLKWFKKEHEGSALLRASKYLKCDDIFVSGRGVASITTDLTSTIDYDEDEINLELEPIANIKALLDTNTKILEILKEINSKLEAPKKKPLLEEKKNAKTNSKS